MLIVPIEKSVRLISNSGKIPLLHKRKPPREILGVFVCFNCITIMVCGQAAPTYTTFSFSIKFRYI